MKLNKNNRFNGHEIFNFHKSAISLLLEMQQEAIQASSPNDQVWREDWWWESTPSKPNREYVHLEWMLKDVIAEFKKLNEVVA